LKLVSGDPLDVGDLLGVGLHSLGKSLIDSADKYVVQLVLPPSFVVLAAVQDLIHEKQWNFANVQAKLKLRSSDNGFGRLFALVPSVALLCGNWMRTYGVGPSVREGDLQLGARLQQQLVFVVEDEQAESAVRLPSVSIVAVEMASFLV